MCVVVYGGMGDGPLSGRFSSVEHGHIVNIDKYSFPNFFSCLTSESNVAMGLTYFVDRFYVSMHKSHNGFHHFVVAMLVTDPKMHP